MATSPSPLLVRVRLPREDACLDVRPTTVSTRLGSPSPPKSDATGGSLPPKRAATDGAARARRRAKRKSTYDVRRNEMRRLAAEMERLEARLEELRTRRGMPSREQQLSLKKKKQETALMGDAWRAQAFTMCGVEALIGNHVRAQPMSPLHTRIRLGRDQGDRHRTLETVRRAKLDLGIRYVSERFRDVDDTEPSCDQQSWTNARGDLCYRRAEILMFEGVKSVKQVFDALQFALNNMEICVAEKLGQLALREDIDSGDMGVVNQRIVSAIGTGLQLEMNVVSFTEYRVEDGEEVAHMATDTVDEDELYPFMPSKRLRKEVSGALTMLAFRRSTNEGSTETEELVVVMKRCACVSILKPQFPITRAALEYLRTNVTIWGDVITTTIREYLRAQVPSRE